MVVALAALVAFAGTLGHQLVWDDLLLRDVIDARLRAGGLPALLSSQFQLRLDDPLGYYRPVVLLTLWFDGRLASLLPASYHLTNVLLHVAASLLVLALLRLVPLSARAAGLGATLFALHPVHTESVAFVSGRTDLLAALFSLAAAVCWAASRRAGGGPRAGLLAASGLSLFLAGLSKEIAFVLPAALLAWDALGAQGERPAAWARRNAPWVACWGAALAAVFLLRWLVAGVGLGRAAAGGWSPWAAAGPAVTYLRLLVLPWPLRTSYSAAQAAPGALSAVAAILLLALCAATASRRQGRVGLLALAWIAAFLAPVLGVVNIGAAPLAERFLYLPSVGVCLLLGFSLDALARRGGLRVPVLAAAALLAAAAVAASVAASRVWRDERTLFSRMIEEDPANPTAHHDLALHLHRAGDLEGARRHYTESLRLKPENPDALIGLGVIASTLGEHREEAAWYRRALAIDPGNVRAWVNLRAACADLGDAECVRRAEQRLGTLGPPPGR